MTIRRDYSRTFFSNRRRRNSRLFGVAFLSMLIIGFVVYVTSHFDRLQLQALDAVGLAPTGTPFASTLANDGMNAYTLGDISLSLTYFAQAVRQQPNNVDYLVEYGNLLIEDGDLELAIEIGNRAVELAPTDPRGYVVVGRALMYDEPAEAIQVTIRGLEADENYAPLLAIQGVAYTQLSRYREGLQQTLLAIELAPNDPFVLRASFTPLVYVGRYQDAATYLQEAISLNPNITAPYFELASLYRIQRPEIYQPEMAVALYNRILEIDEENARAYLRLCQTFATVEEADFSLAEPYCQEALTLDPNEGEIHRTLGQMQYNRRNYEGAIDSFETCVDLGAGDIECIYLRGLAHFWLAQCDQAWALLTEAQQMTNEANYGTGVEDAITIGLGNIKELCPGYDSVALPTPNPPTPIPPTPIGGFG